MAVYCGACDLRMENLDRERHALKPEVSFVVYQCPRCGRERRRRIRRRGAAEVFLSGTSSEEEERRRAKARRTFTLLDLNLGLHKKNLEEMYCEKHNVRYVTDCPGCIGGVEGWSVRSGRSAER